jgi:hypothetical protein
LSRKTKGPTACEGVGSLTEERSAAAAAHGPRLFESGALHRERERRPRRSAPARAATHAARGGCARTRAGAQPVLIVSRFEGVPRTGVTPGELLNVATVCVRERLTTGRITAIDRSKKMIEMAARRNREHVAGGRAVLKTAALEEADFGDERFRQGLRLQRRALLASAEGGAGDRPAASRPRWSGLSLLGRSPHAARPSSRPSGPAEREDPAGRVLCEPSAGQGPAPGSRGLRDRTA